MGAQEKVSLQKFTIETALDPEAIREACGRAAEAGSTQFLGHSIHEYEASDSVLGFVISGPGGFVELMGLAVGWEELENGKRRVKLDVGDDFATERWALYGFIPLSPRSPTAMGSLKRFSARLRKELS